MLKTEKLWFRYVKIAARFYLKNIFLSVGITLAAFIAGTIGVILSQDENGFLTPLYATIVILNVLTLPLQGKWMKRAVEKDQEDKNVGTQKMR